jgi:methionyl-tRNA formyltransferase
VAWTTLAGVPLKIWQTAPLVAPTGDEAAPGAVAQAGSQGIDIACGSGLLRITSLQFAGARRMDAAAFLAGRELAPGTVLGA